MKTLVTGANGFLGRRIVRRLLCEGVGVRAFVRPGRSVEAAGVEVFEGDICDEAAVEAAMRDVNGVVHAAARVEATGTWEEFADVNVRGTRRVLGAARTAGVQRVVHVSSLSVYRVPYDGVTIRDDSPYESESEARGYYSRSKLAADRVACDAARRGVPVVVLRPGLLYGPGKRPALARQSFTAAGCKLILATPDYELPLAYVDNVADAVWLALRAEGVAGQAFTLVDENVKQGDYVIKYRAAAGEHWRAVFLPVGAVALAALVLERGLRLARRRSPITYHQVRRATQSAHYDCSRAAQVLGWRPAVSVEEGLRRTFESLRREPPGQGAPVMASMAT